MLFEQLDLLADPEPRCAALNMALDEVLLARAPAPLLRVYRWARPAVSFGYFERWQTVVAAHPGREIVRRWTGGGVVLHGEDWTYSLIVPRSFPFARVNAAESYHVLHEALARVIEATEAGKAVGAVELTPAAAEKTSRACFENPARHDLLVAGRKIAGGAQRRSRFGLLHQGSVQGIVLPPDFATRLAAALGERQGLPRQRLCPEELEDAARLASSKYATEAWNQKY